MNYLGKCLDLLMHLTAHSAKL